MGRLNKSAPKQRYTTVFLRPIVNIREEMCPFVMKQHVKRIGSIAEALRVLNVYTCPIWDDSAVKTKDSMFFFQPTFSAFNGKSFTLLPSDTCFPSALTYTIPPSAVKLTRTTALKVWR